MTYESNKAHRPADDHPWRSSGLAKPTAVEVQRTCRKCGETKPVEDFPRPTTSRRRYSYCTLCANALAQAYRSNNREVLLERWREYRERNKDVLNARKRAVWRREQEQAGRAIPPLLRRWWTATRAALEMGLTPNAVTVLARRGRLVGEKVPNPDGGVMWQIDPASVAALLAERAQQSPSEKERQHANNHGWPIAEYGKKLRGEA